MVEETKTSIFQRPAWVVVFALTAAMAWGWAYPLIKLGFGEFGITGEMTGSKMLFAGIRFAISGLIVLAIARGKGKDFSVVRPRNWWYLLVFALLNTTLHYACFYIGLSHSEGARAAILNSLGVFLLVLLACLFFKSDRLTTRKIIGCAIGFAGILALNIGGGDSGRFTFWGDGMIILNALCSASAGLMMATTCGARAQGRTDSCGMLKEGLDADIVLVDFSAPHLMPCHSVPAGLVFSAKGGDVAMTMVRGKILYQNGKFPTIDLNAVVSEIMEYAIPRLLGENKEGV